MSKEWAEQVKEKLDAYNLRRKEIESTLNDLLKEINGILNEYKLIDEQNLIWKVRIGR